MVAVAGNVLVLLGSGHLTVELLTGLARNRSTGALAKQLKECVLELEVLHQLLLVAGRLSSLVTQSCGAASKSLNQSRGHLGLAQDALVETLESGIAVGTLRLTSIHATIHLEVESMRVGGLGWLLNLRELGLLLSVGLGCDTLTD